MYLLSELRLTVTDVSAAASESVQRSSLEGVTFSSVHQWRVHVDMNVKSLLPY